ncbi:MAG: VOC family protein [Xanthobacteraceae bacterium]|nr:VOC family protein [Xanthobacteraceae bacterium]MBY0613010.1 VOC family protein [Beijerinckiaceae bacterium]
MMRSTMLAACVYAALSMSPAWPQTAPVSPPREPPPNKTALMFRPNHVCLRVKDLDAEINWWSDVFGAQLVRRSKVPTIDPGAEIAFMVIADNFHIELVGGGAPQQAAPPPKDITADYGIEGWKHIGFEVDDMDRAVAYLRSKGVEVAYETDRPDYGVRIALFKEPNGYFIELYAPRG